MRPLLLLLALLCSASAHAELDYRLQSNQTLAPGPITTNRPVT